MTQPQVGHLTSPLDFEKVANKLSQDRTQGSEHACERVSEDWILGEEEEAWVTECLGTFTHGYPSCLG